ncbi:ribonuclease P protein component [Adlercreutzia sp. ZJ304]|uniref:ribonuclease P protein component n=1 Tax=Adlercreutzia sp. ZJ304 TaxID=2709791 RepID=UPI0013EBF3DC|nr:ribonuclease P protein component [Adlercreutzia sp. ZJ304]
METIKSNAEISKIFKEGKKSSNKYITVIIFPKNLEELSLNADFEHGLNGRVAFIAGRKNGNACWRNRAKRRLRELTKQFNGPWSGYDVLLVAKHSLTEANYSKVSSTIKNTLQELGLVEPGAE